MKNPYMIKMRKTDMYGYCPEQERVKIFNRICILFRSVNKADNFLKSLIDYFICILLVPPVSAQDASYKGAIRKGYVGGYMSAKPEKVDESFNAGYSMYTAAWPIVKEYPGRSFQTGLFGTWMRPQNDGPGAGKGRDWSQPKGKYGVAQLSPWLLGPVTLSEMKGKKNETHETRKFREAIEKSWPGARITWAFS